MTKIKKKKFVLSKRILTSNVALALLGTALAISLIMAVVSYKSPTALTNEITVSQINHDSSFDYVVEVAPSLIYDNQTILHEDAALYLKLLREINVTMNYRITSPQGIEKVQGTITPVLVVTASSWSKSFLLSDPIPLNKTETSVQVNLNMTDIITKIGIIQKETGIRANEYNISAIMKISLDVTLANGHEYSQEFMPAYTLSVMEDKSSVKVSYIQQSKTFKDITKNTVPTYLSILGYSLPVTTARTTFIASSAVIAPILTIAILKRERNELTDEVKKIMKKYGDIIIEGHVAKSDHSVIIELNDFEKVAEISDRRQKPIIKHGGEFYLVDNNTIYYYRIRGLDDHIPKK